MLVIPSVSWWMMQELDDSSNTVESSAALDNVYWVLKQLVRVSTEHCGRGQEGENDKDKNDDPNDHPKKRLVVSNTRSRVSMNLSLKFIKGSSFKVEYIYINKDSGGYLHR